MDRVKLNNNLDVIWLIPFSGTPSYSFIYITYKSESEVAQLCPTLCDPMDYSPPGSSVHGTFQARVLEWGAISFSNHLQVFALFLRSVKPTTGASQVAQWLRIHCNAGDRGDMGLIPGLGRSSGVGMSTHSCSLAWKIPWTADPGGVQSIRSQRVRHNWAHNHTYY